jgi:hypothetical protein
MRFFRPVVVLVALGTGCKQDTPATAEAENPPAQGRTTPPRTMRQTPERMRDHFKAGVLVRDALIAGDLELAKWNAIWLAEREPEPDVTGWSPSMNELRARARRIAEASDVTTACAATADLALECGRCHQANGASPRFVVTDRRVAASGRRPHMPSTSGRRSGCGKG